MAPARTGNVDGDAVPARRGPVGIQLDGVAGERVDPGVAHDEVARGAGHDAVGIGAAVRRIQAVVDKRPFDDHIRRTAQVDAVLGRAFHLEILEDERARRGVHEHGVVRPSCPSTTRPRIVTRMQTRTTLPVALDRMAFPSLSARITSRLALVPPRTVRPVWIGTWLQQHRVAGDGDGQRAAMRPNGLPAVPSPAPPGATYSVDASVDKGINAAARTAPSSAREQASESARYGPPVAGGRRDVR